MHIQQWPLALSHLIAVVSRVSRVMEGKEPLLQNKQIRAHAPALCFLPAHASSQKLGRLLNLCMPWFPEEILILKLGKFSESV